jgi:hypothetical protein
MTRKRIFIKPYSPDLRWIESLLGESLQIPAEPLLYGTANPQYDTSAIPQGPYCYDIAARDSDQYVPCLYFIYTERDSVRCDYLGVEAVDGMSQKLIDHFGSRDQAVAAGVIDTDTLPDSIKECDFHLAYPSTVENLQHRMDDYEQAIFGQYRDAWDQPYSSRSWGYPSQLWAVTYARYGIWEALCGMTEDVPQALIKRLQLIDAMLRGHTEPAETTIENAYSEEAKKFASPEKQFWYLYRKNFAAVTDVHIISKMA